MKEFGKILLTVGIGRNQSFRDMARYVTTLVAETTPLSESTEEYWKFTKLLVKLRAFFNYYNSNIIYFVFIDKIQDCVMRHQKSQS